MSGNFVSIKSLPRVSRGDRSSFDPQELIYAIDQTGGRERVKYAMRIGIPSHAAKEARLIKGDRVDILFDKEAGLGLVKRVNSGGWAVSAPHKKQAERLYVCATYTAGMPSVAKSVGCPCEVTPDGIIFTLPDEVSFTENLREIADKQKEQA